MAGWATTASAGVARLAPAAGEELAPLSAVVTSPDGSQRALALTASPRPLARELLVNPVVPSPDGRRLARTPGSRLVLIPTDGASASTVAGRGLRTGREGREWVTSWWNADGTALTIGPFVRRDGTNVVRRCTVAPAACRSEATPGRAPVSALPDGRVLFTGSFEDRLFVADATDRGWLPRSAAWIRRAKRSLTRRHPDALWAEAGAGRPRETFWSSSDSPASGFRGFEQLVRPGAASGALLVTNRRRYTLSTRRDDGRLEVRIDTRISDPEVWSIREGRARRPFPGVARSVTFVVAPTPDGGWVGGADGGNRPVRVTAQGEVIPLSLGGRPITPAALREALGEPPSSRLPSPGDHPRSLPEYVEVIGFEQATSSAIVSYYDRLGRVVARVPVDGRAPSVVERAEPLDTYVAW
jgi:hypothetical protein